MMSLALKPKFSCTWLIYYEMLFKLCLLPYVVQVTDMDSWDCTVEDRSSATVEVAIRARNFTQVTNKHEFCTSHNKV